jgi:DNA-binding winged helix-turn-helix (wHTH) protein
MIYAFADCELDTGLFVLRRAGADCAIEPRIYDLLLFLIKHRHRVVLKHELLDELWQGRCVSAASLNHCVMLARRAVGDCGEAQDVIRTHRRRGFRFAAQVSERETTGTRRSHPPVCESRNG